MRRIKLVWLASLILTILLFIDDIAGTDTEDGNGLVVANEGMITGKHSWPLLTLFAMIFALTSLVWLFGYLRAQRR